MTEFTGELLTEYPFTQRSIEIEGMKYSYIDEGVGPVILFVHGNPTWSFAWRNLVKGLSSSFRCIAIDHIGMGLSDKPQKYDYRIGQHIDNLTQFIERMELEQVTLVGHDWGGCIGMGAAARLPGRFKQFVMMNTAAFRSQQIPKRIAACRIPVLGKIAVKGLNAFSRAALTMAVDNHERMTPTIKKGYLLPYDSWSNRVSVQRFVEEIPLKESHPSYMTLVDVENGLSQFQNHPWLFFWGEKDWCFNTDFLDEWEQRFPHAETVRFPEAGHYVFEDAYQEIVPKLKEFASQ